MKRALLQGTKKSAFAALLLILPGFITDGIGFLLLIPFTRRFLINCFVRKNKIPNQQESKETLDGEIIEEKETIEKKKEKDEL